MEEGNRSCPCVPTGANPYASSMGAPILTESIVSQEHPEPAALERFLRGEASRAETRAVVRHLLAGCAVCSQVTLPLWELGDEPLRAVEDPEG
jgi:hypothetical protein